MTESLTYKGKAPETYAESVLFCLAQATSAQVARAAIWEKVEKSGQRITVNQFRAAISNFKSMHLLEYKDRLSLTLDLAKLSDFAGQVARGECGAWRRAETDAGRVRSQRGQTTDIIRAIFAAHPQALTIREAQKIAVDKIGFNLGASAVRWVAEKKGELTRTGEKSGSSYKYAANQLLFENSVDHLRQLATILPGKRQALLQRFAAYYPDEVRQIEESPAPPAAMPDARPRTFRTIRAIDAIRAIFCAYDKPLTVYAVRNIAKERLSMDILANTVRSYVCKRGETVTLDEKLGKARLHTAGKKLFKANAYQIAHLIDIIPDKKETILKKFAVYCPAEVQEIRDAEVPAPQPAAGAAPAQHLKPARYIDAMRAIFAAYERPLTTVEISRIAREKWDLKVTKNTIQWYLHNKYETVDTGGRVGNAHQYTARKELFQQNGDQIDYLIRLLPEERATILTRFAAYHPAEVQQIRDAEAPAPPAAADPLQSMVVLPTLADAEAYTAQHLTPDADAGPGDEPDAATDDDAVDIINVGAAIVSYINKLKKQLVAALSAKTEEQAASIPAEKYQRVSANIIGLKAERDNLRFQLDKVRKIIELRDKDLRERDDRIKALEGELLKLRHRPRVSAVQAPTKSMKVEEVARITKLIKKNVAEGQTHPAARALKA